MTIRNRIKSHRRVRAGDLVPHELNFRLHPDQQRAALESLYQHIGFARSLLAYELPDGKLKLLDGHLRRDIDPDMEVEVEVLDLNDDEARTLLLSLDPLADLAETHRDFYQRLRDLAPPPPPELDDLWQLTVDGPQADGPTSGFGTDKTLPPAQFLVLIECRDEKEQVEFLARFQREGVACRALVG